MFIVNHALLSTKRHKLLFIIMAFLLSICAVIYYLTCSPSGFKFSLKIIQPILSSQGIKYDSNKITGNIFAFHLNNLAIKTDSTLINISDINLTYNPLKLLIGDIQINSANITSVNIKIIPDNKNRPPSTEKSQTPIIFPLNLYAKDINIKNINVVIGTKSVVTATKFKANINIINNLLSLTNISGNIYDQSIILNDTNGTLSFHPPFMVDINTNWQLNSENILNSQLHSHLSGPLIKTFSLRTSGYITTSYQQIGELNFEVISNINKDKLVNNIQSLNFNSNHLSGIIELNYTSANKLIYRANVNGKYYTQSTIDTIPYAIDLTAKNVINKSDRKSTITLSSCLFSFNSIDINCQAKLESTSNSMTLKTLTLTNTERNDNLAIHGDIFPSPNLNWQANLEQVNYYLTQMNAKIQTEGNLSHSWQQPLLSTHTTIKGLEYKSQVLPSIILDASHTKEKQKVDISISSPELNIKANINGQWKQNRWAGHFSNIKLKANKSLWMLSGQPTITYFAENIKLENLCLTSTSSHACINITAQDQEFSIQPDIEINHVTLNQIFKNYTTNSDFIFKAKIAHQKYIGTMARYAANITPGYLSLIKINQQKDNIEDVNLKSFSKINIAQATSAGTMNNNSLLSKTNIKFDNQDFISFDIKAINILSNEVKNIFIDTKLTSHIKKMGFIAYLLKLPINIQGEFNANLSLYGPLKNPTFQGEATLSDLDIALTQIGTKLTDTNITAKAINPFGLDIVGTSYIQKSPINFNADLTYNFISNMTKLNANITTKNIKAVDLPQLQMNLSSDLAIKSKDKSLYISGEIEIDRAKIILDDISNNTSTNNFSSDIVYINNQNQIIYNQLALPIFSDIKVNLGQQTMLYGLGLNGYLVGELQIFSTPNQLTTAYGNIELKDGVYNNYGKRFNIVNKSGINYNYSPINNPNLNITAEYHLPPDVVLANNTPSQIGIKIQGTANDPKLTLFSSPSMSQADILAYIVLGHSLQQNANQNNATAMQSAAVAFALNGGSGTVLTEIQDKLGITDLAFGTMSSVPTMSDQLNNDPNNTTQNSTALFIGKSITSKFYVSYGISIFTGQQEVDTVYKLSDNWSIRTDATTLDTGADLIYQISP